MMNRALRFWQEWLRASTTSSWLSKRNVASLYARGEGVRQNLRRARVWYARSAKAGDESALYDLALMLLEGEGGPVEQERGANMLLEAGRLGDPMAQKVLAYAYEDGGWGFPVDHEKAEYWRKLAVDQEMQV